MNLYPFINTRKVRVYLNQNKDFIKSLVWVIIIFVILGLVGRGEYLSLTKIGY